MEENGMLTPSSHGLSAAAAGKTTMDKETDAKMFAAALYVITDMWGKEMGDLQRASLANQIVREIERRGIIQPAAAAEAPSAERVRNNPAPPVQMEAVAWTLVLDGEFDPEELTFKTLADAEAYRDDCSDPKPIIVPLFASPVPSSERDEISNDWVKRSERLPSVGGTYLVGAYDDTMSLPRTFVRFWASLFLFDTGPEWQIRDAEHEHRTVEYWIDLPPHPEHPGRKPAVRADRDDIIEMCARTEPTKYDLVPGRYQKRTLIKRISYVLTGGQFGIEPGYVVLGLSDPEVTP